MQNRCTTRYFFHLNVDFLEIRACIQYGQRGNSAKYMSVVQSHVGCVFAWPDQSALCCQVSELVILCAPSHYAVIVTAPRAASFSCFVKFTSKIFYITLHSQDA